MLFGFVPAETHIQTGSRWFNKMCHKYNIPFAVLRMRSPPMNPAATHSPANSIRFTSVTRQTGLVDMPEPITAPFTLQFVYEPPTTNPSPRAAAVCAPHLEDPPVSQNSFTAEKTPTVEDDRIGDSLLKSTHQPRRIQCSSTIRIHWKIRWQLRAYSKKVAHLPQKTHLSGDHYTQTSLPLAPYPLPSLLRNRHLR